jgi:large subunit ribosomal protein L3
MANSSMGLLGTKLGMTQLFEDDGTVIPVTVVLAGPNTVLQVKTGDTKDGYHALQLGFGAQKPQRLNGALRGHLAKSRTEAVRHIAEIRVSPEVAASHEAGRVLSADEVFSPGERVDVTGTSKGRGFAGVMKRHHFSGFKRTHGVHEYFRHGGSIGTRLTPGMTLKGTRMGGRMGGERVTTQNLTVVKVDPERQLLFIRGAVPGAKGGLVKVRKAVKNG